MAKCCSACGERKPSSEFYKNSRYADGRQGECKPCCRTRQKRYRAENREVVLAKKRAYYVKKEYGLTVEDYEALLARGCAICGTHEGRLHADHDHRNGRVRAALCSACNHGLGHFYDKPELMRAAASYVEEWQEAHGVV